MIRKGLAIIAFLGLLVACEAETTSSPIFDPAPGLIPDVVGGETNEGPASQENEERVEATVTPAPTATPENFCTSSVVGLSFDCPPDDWEVVEDEVHGGSIVMQIEKDDETSMVVLDRQLDFNRPEWERWLGAGPVIGGLDTLAYREEQAWHGFILIDDTSAIQFDGFWGHPEYEALIEEIIKSVQIWE